MDEGTNIQKIDLDKVDWRCSREFFESLGEALDKLDDKDEAYDFTWVGKRKAIIEAGAPINKTFRPNVEASKNWDTTENLFIEGDNLDALKLLQESYLGKVKMIYIDPPYNTGKDFVYHDDFKRSSTEWDEETGYRDDEGNIQETKRNPLQPNLKANGRYHSDWLSMMYPRLKLARNLLSNDGVIFISIDDNEQANLKKMCDEIYGENNFIACLVWEKKKKGAYLSGSITNIKEYILCYSRSVSNFNGLIGEINSDSATYPVIKTTNTRGTRIIRGGISSKYAEKDCTRVAGTRISVGNQEMILLTDLIIKDGILSKDVKVDSNWIYSQDLLDQYAESNKLYITQDLYFRRIVDESREKMLKDLLPRVGIKGVAGSTFILSDNLFDDGWGTNEDANAELHSLLEQQNIMDFPKPSKLISKIIASVKDKDMIVVDFFSGAGTTAQAVMQLNAQDGGNRKHILVQLPEETGKESEAYKAGYKSISEIARERIYRSGEKIIEEFKELVARREKPLDIGFRALSVADTNYKDVYRSATDTTQQELLGTVDNVKEDRSELDLLYGVLTASALELNRPLETRDISGSKVYLYDYFDEVSGLAACFSDSVSEETIKAIATLKPLTAVFKDSSFPDSQAKVNLSEHFRIISPDTRVKVI